jgi:hypothetical protein
MQGEQERAAMVTASRHFMKTTVVEISCIEVWREISNYLDDELESDLKTRMAFHFKKCAHCQAILDGTANTLRLLADGDWYPLPAGFGERLYERLRQQNSLPNPS